MRMKHCWLGCLLALAALVAGCDSAALPVTSAPPTTTVAPKPTATPKASLAQQGVFMAIGNGAPVGEIDALSASDGASLWNQPLDVASTEPAAEDGVLYVWVSHQVGGALEALRVRDGKQLWTTQENAFVRHIVAADGNIYTESTPGVIDAFSAQDGKHLWAHSDTACTDENFAAGGGMIFVSPGNGYPNSGCDATLRALRANDGTLLWRSTITLPVGAALDAIVYSNNLLYVSTQHALYALRAGTGAAVWQFQFITGSGGETIRLDDTSLYTGVTIGQGIDVMAFQLADGTRIWSHTLQDAAYLSPFAVGDGMLYIPVTLSQTSGYLQALNAADGTPKWTDQLAGGITYPATENGLVFIETWPGSPASGLPYTLHALRATNGSAAWTKQMNGGAYQPLVLPLS